MHRVLWRPTASAALRASARRLVLATSPSAFGTDTLHRVTAAALIAGNIVTRRRNAPCGVERGYQCHESHCHREQDYATFNQKSLHAVIYSRIRGLLQAVPPAAWSCSLVGNCHATTAATECVIEIRRCSWSRQVGSTRLCERYRSRRHGRKNGRTLARPPRPWPWHQLAGRSSSSKRLPTHPL